MVAIQRLRTIVHVALVAVLWLNTVSAQTSNQRASTAVSVMLELWGAPTAAVRQIAASPRASEPTIAAAQRQQLAQIERDQQLLLRSLAPVQAQVLFRTQRVFNGVAVRVEAGQLESIRRMPMVKAIRPLVPKLPALSRSVPLIGAPAVWSGLGGGATGENITIGVIDSGIDYTHRDFGGTGDFAQNDGTIIEDRSFPTAKVVGGYDFAGDNYNALSETPANRIPRPDPDPLDCATGSAGGHGTHVAGIAAGFGVGSDGQTYTGPYNQWLDFNQFAIGPGVAPGAKLVALRVFGCSGATDLVAQALDYAVDPNGDGDTSDRLDVVNMSLGSRFGAGDDVDALAAQAAVEAGVVVVAAAGNSGDTTFISSSPGTAAGAISVAASDDVVFQPNGVASFSSRGPRLDGMLKPDIAAPGVGIRSAAAGTTAGSLNLSGTSMATPHVTGAMALLKQLHPNWNPFELKALAMNTATAGLRSNQTGAPFYGPSRVGAGRIDLQAAAQQQVIGFSEDAPGLVSVSFGMLEVASTLSRQKRVMFRNNGSAAAALNLAYQPVGAHPGVAYTISPTQLNLAPRASAEVTVTLTADATTLQHTRDATQDATQAGEPRSWLSEAQGYVTFSGGAAGRLPVYAAVRPIAAMHADRAMLSLANPAANTQEITLGLAGRGTNALVSAFELAYASPPITSANAITRSLDLRFVGVSTTRNAATPMLYVGVATYGEWPTPNVVDFEISIDTNRDQKPDYLLYNSSRLNGTTDAFLSTLATYPDGRIIAVAPLNMVSAQVADTRPFNTNVMALGLSVQALGLPAAGRFDYMVRSFSVASGELVDATPWLSYRPGAAGLAFEAGIDGKPIYADQPATTIRATYNRASYTGNGSRGVLLFHHQNAEGQRAEVIGGPALVLLPLVGR